jgi:biotin synthase
MNLDRPAVLGWLRERDAGRLETLWSLADRTRRRHVGDEIHLRGLLEISNHCRRSCLYCGLRAANTAVQRYRMDAQTIIAGARDAAERGYGTVVLQAGEDPGLEAGWIAGVVRAIRADTGLVVTLSLGERSREELALWRSAGAGRYLLRFETSDPRLYAHLHPAAPGGPRHRTELLPILRELGYEVGSGIMVGLPGQGIESVADDLLLFRELDLDMIGVGPFVPHPGTPLGALDAVAAEEQVEPDEETVMKVVALARLLRPDANIPATTAVATCWGPRGRERALLRGANVVMPDLTPPPYRAQYEIYPGKTCPPGLELTMTAIGRRPGIGPGGRRREEVPWSRP